MEQWKIRVTQPSVTFNRMEQLRIRAIQPLGISNRMERLKTPATAQSVISDQGQLRIQVIQPLAMSNQTELWKTQVIQPLVTPEKLKPNMRQFSFSFSSNQKIREEMAEKGED